MQCLQCGRFFVAKDIFTEFCSDECFEKAQRERLSYISTKDCLLDHYCDKTEKHNLNDMPVLNHYSFLECS